MNTTETITKISNSSTEHRTRAIATVKSLTASLLEGYARKVSGINSGGHLHEDAREIVRAMEDLRITEADLSIPGCEAGQVFSIGQTDVIDHTDAVLEKYAKLSIAERIANRDIYRANMREKLVLLAFFRVGDTEGFRLKDRMVELEIF